MREPPPFLFPAGRLDALLVLLEPYHPIAVYAFGSRVTGEVWPGSDLDLAVFLPPGTTMPLDEKLRLVDRLAEAARCEVDLVVLNDAGLPIAFEVVSRGRVLYETSPEERTDAEDVVVRDYLDFLPALERSCREMIDEVRESGEPYEPGFNRHLVATRALTVRGSLDRLRQMAALDRKRFARTPDAYAVAAHHLRRALQALLDLGRHIAVKSGSGNPQSYAEIFDLLERGRALPEALADKGRTLVGHRNRLVHEYAEIPGGELWRILRSSPDDLAALTSRLIAYAGKTQKPAPL